MGIDARVEIQNRTPFPMTWAHFEREDAPPGHAYRNLLDAALPTRRGRVFEAIEAGRVRLVCGLETGGLLDRAREHAVGAIHTLVPEAAVSACVEYDEARGFSVRTEDAHTRPGEDAARGRPVGPYRWNGRRGRARAKDGRRLAGDGR